MSMYYFSKQSKEKLSTCDKRLQMLFHTVIQGWDCAIICGHRNEEEQNQRFIDGTSKVRYPFSKHNNIPSKAVDVYPYPVDLNDLGSFYMFAGYVLRVAKELGIPIRYGGDWDGDKKTADQTFNDLGHWELVG